MIQESVSATVLALGLAFSLGLRHGLDTDHLLAIDAMTRLYSPRHPRLARCCGLFFSLGHGLVVLSIALGVHLLRAHDSPPAWLALTGSLMSIGLLLILGLGNLRHWHVSPHHTAQAGAPGSPLWLAQGLLKRFEHPTAALLVGALFAVSYDTVAQAVLFGSNVLQVDIPLAPLVVASAFCLGMLCVDTAAGWWLGALLARYQRHARDLSRAMGMTVAVMSLCAAALGMARLCSSRFDQWAQDAGLYLSLGTLVMLVATFFGTRLAKHQGRSVWEGYRS